MTRRHGLGRFDRELNILDQLKGDFPLNDAVLEAPEHYRRDWQDISDPDVQWICHRHPPSQGIARENVLSLTHPDDVTRRRRLLIGSLMWGYGVRGLRWTGLTPIESLLADATLDERLKRCDEALARADVAGAYSVLASPKIRQVGPAFFTKVLYFFGRSANPSSEYPLIFDTFVCKSLARLTGFSLLAEVAYTPTPSPEAYATFVQVMHSWGRQLGTSTDALEFYLYRMSSMRKPDGDEASRERFLRACDLSHFERGD